MCGRVGAQLEADSDLSSLEGPSGLIHINTFRGSEGEITLCL